MSNIARTTDTLRVTIANGSAAGERTFTKTLRSDYDECIGLVAYITSNGGDANFRMELVNKHGQPIVEMVHNREFEGNTAVPINERYKEVLFLSKDEKVTLRVSTNSTLTSDLTLDFVFKLQKIN